MKAVLSALAIAGMFFVTVGFAAEQSEYGVSYPTTTSTASAEQTPANVPGNLTRDDNSCSTTSCSVSCAWNKSAVCANPCAYEGGDCSSCTCN
jgi:hypothetical protein